MVPSCGRPLLSAAGPDPADAAATSLLSPILVTRLPMTDTEIVQGLMLLLGHYLLFFTRISVTLAVFNCAVPEKCFDLMSLLKLDVITWIKFTRC